MNGRLTDDGVRAGGDARQRYHDARGYGRPLGGDELLLSRVEAAHLLFRGDLDAVDGMDFRAFFSRAARERGRFARLFAAYADLRDRGFYLSPTREGWPGVDEAADGLDFLVHPRGTGPHDGAVAHRVRVVDERRRVAVDGLAGTTLAVVDEEAEVSYFEATAPELEGDSHPDLPRGVPAALLGERVVCWDAPPALYRAGFYGTPLSGRDVDGAGDDADLQLSLLEAAHLAGRGVLDVDVGSDAPNAESDDPDAAADGEAAVLARGREAEGERFTRRLAVYGALRDRGVVPRTGFKFGADFRTYAAVDDVDDLGHSEHLVRVVRADAAVRPRELSLDVRMAGGVNKRMVFAMAGKSGEVRWLSVGRLTP
jgi:tRNA-intron endonuclease